MILCDKRYVEKLWNLVVQTFKVKTFLSKSSKKAFQTFHY